MNDTLFEKQNTITDRNITQKRIPNVTDSNRYTREFSLQRSASFNHKGTLFHRNNAYAACNHG